MKKVLLVSYYFPPLGLGGTQRAVKFARYLPQFDWEPTVLTVKPIAYWAQDPSLLAEVHHVSVVRTGSLDPQRLLHLAGKSDTGFRASAGDGRRGLPGFINDQVLPLFLVPDSKILWRCHAVHAASRLLRTEKFAAIVTTGPPHSAHLIGRTLAHRFSLPWVADFRDAWFGGVVMHEPTRWHRRWQRHLQNSVLRSADAIVSVSEGIQKELQRLELQAGKFHLIPNGFDESDYPPRSKRVRGDRFVFCHCGSISRYSHPGPLLQALAQLTKRDPKLIQQIHFNFVGFDATGSFAKEVRASGLEEMITMTGYQPHRDALQHLVDADALILIAQGEAGDPFIPGKTYEYLGAKKPVLAITNVHDTIERLQSFPWISLCSPEKIDEIAAQVIRLAGVPKAGAMDTRLLSPFDRVHQTGRLAKILDGLTKTGSNSGALRRST
jgi:glycosyltransferase involved in cell wall biosynthesis